MANYGNETLANFTMGNGTMSAFIEKQVILENLRVVSISKYIIVYIQVFTLQRVSSLKLYLASKVCFSPLFRTCTLPFPIPWKYK